MPRGTHLSQHEQGQIQALRLNNWTIRRIAVHLSRSRNIVAKFLRNPQQYGKKKRPGRPSKLTSTARRALLREAHKGHLCSEVVLRKSPLDGVKLDECGVVGRKEIQLGRSRWVRVLLARYTDRQADVLKTAAG